MISSGIARMRLSPSGSRHPRPIVTGPIEHCLIYPAYRDPYEKVAGQLGLKSSRPLTQLGPVCFQNILHYLIFWTESQMNKQLLMTNVAIKLLIDRIEVHLKFNAIFPGGGGGV